MSLDTSASETLMVTLYADMSRVMGLLGCGVLKVGHIEGKLRLTVQ